MTAQHIPQARWSEAWAKLAGHVLIAQQQGDPIDPTELLDYMRELKHEAIAPVRAWVNNIDTREGGYL